MYLFFWKTLSHKYKKNPFIRRKQMEFLLVAVAVAIAVYIGYSYYKAKKAVSDVYVLPESAEVKVEPLNIVKVEVGDVSLAEAEKRVDTVREEIKKAKPKKEPKSPSKAEVAEKRTRKGGKFVGDDKSTPDVNEAFKDGKAPAKKAPTKKKPNIKIAK